MEFRILGPLEVIDCGRSVRLGRSREQKILAALLLDANRVVSLSRLVDVVWDNHPPKTAGKVVRNCLSALRQRLVGVGGPDGVIVTDPAGYALRVPDGRLDLQVFRHTTARARRLADAGQLAEAARLLRTATALWRGPVLAGVSGQLIERAAAALNEQRLTVLEEYLSYELALGGREELVAELAVLVAEHPLRESLRGQLMVALHRCGRRTDALEVYRQGRRILIDELGLEPGVELREVEQAILNDDRQPARTVTPHQPHLPVPAQLPADVDGFVGRADHLARLAGHWQAHSAAGATTVALTVIVGPPGIGKTALGVHWAHQVRDQFPDGQLYIDLRGYAGGPPVRPIDALALFLTSLGIPADQVPMEVEPASAMYRSTLAGRRFLVVLDNAVNSDQVRPLLPGTSGCIVLVTSRDRLAGLVAGIGARLLTLDVLGPAEAYELLASTIGRTRVAAEPSATAELARLCAYLPLALRIAGAHLAHRRHRGIAGYVAELAAESPLDALAADGDRRTAVRPAFDLSYAALPTQPQRIFRYLGLMPGADISTGAVAALADLPAAEAAGGLDRLANAHLIDEHADGRFTFHDLLRRYARERAWAEEPDAGREGATARLLEWYLRNVEGATSLLYPEILRLPALPGQPPPGMFADHRTALSWLDIERANLVAVVTQAADHGPRTIAWALADRLRGYFHQRMCTVDWRTVALAGRAAAELDGAVTGQAAAELSLGDLHWRMSLYPSAIEHYSSAVAHTERAGWQLGRAAVLGNLGNVYQQSGRLDLATDRYRQALVIAEEAGWVAGQAANLENLGAAFWELGRLDEATDHSRRALEICRATGSRFAQGVVQTGLGEVYHAMGEFEEALDHLTTALALHRQVGNRGGEAETVRVLALVHRDSGRYDEALDLAREALALARAADDRRYEADALNTVASIEHRLGRHETAVETHQEGLRLAREIGNGYPQVEALVGLAHAHLALRESAKAVSCAENGLTLARAAGYQLLERQAQGAIIQIRQ